MNEQDIAIRLTGVKKRYKLGQITESYLCTRLERGFSTLDFYKSLLTE